MWDLLLILLQIHGVLIFLGLATGWAFAAHIRRKTIAVAKLREKADPENIVSMRAGAAVAGAAQANSVTAAEGPGSAFGDEPDLLTESVHRLQLPGVTVVMPARGVSEHVLHNWRSQVLTSYGGKCEFFVVVGSVKDPAYAAASNLSLELRDRWEVRVLIAGPASTCSQKIHNQLHGLASAATSSKYILFLDDDIELHPDTIPAFVSEMEARKDAYLITGYPLDIPGSSLTTFAAAAYHLPLSIGFSTGGRTVFVWGGCMMFRAEDLCSDKHGLVSTLRNGAYSDDMTVAAVAGAHSAVVVCPGNALFLHRLPEEMSLQRFWDYLLRQVFVCQTYSSKHNLIVNQALLWVHCWLSSTLVLSAAGSLLTLVFWIFANHPPFPTFLSQRHWPDSVFVAFVHLLCFIIASHSLHQLLSTGVRLCTTLGRGKDPILKEQELLRHMHLGKVWLGMFMLHAAFPFCTVITMLTNTIDWSGIKYRRVNGRIEVVKCCYD